MAQTKIKAGLFEGIIGNGTDGYFLMSNGDGTMTWSSIISNPTITSIAYPGSVTAADPAGGETITVTGTGFETGAAVTIGGTAAPAVSYVSATQITFTTPVKAAGDYDIVVTNTDTGSATYINGISYNGIPSWTTPTGSLGTFDSGETISTITLQATEPDAGTITFNITSGALPTGLSLTGADIDGTTSLETADTLYTFTVTATDDESQATPRTFTITVTKHFLSTENFTINTYVGDGASTQSIEGGKIGTAASFNGSSSDIDLPSGMQSSTMAVSMFAFFTATPDTDVLIEFENGYGINFLSSDSGYVLAQYANSSGSNVKSNSAITTNQWYHIVANFTSSSAELYIDKVQQTGGTVNNYVTADQNTIGSRRADSFIPAKIDQVRIFNTTLNQTQINQLADETNASSTKFTTDIFGNGSGIALYEFEKGAIDTGGVSGYIGAGGIFDGSSSYTTINSTSTTPFDASSEDFSISAWINVSSFQNDACIISKWGSTSTNQSYFFGFGSSADNTKLIVYEKYGSSTNVINSTSTTITTGSWFHVAYVRNSTQAIIYINGVAETFSNTNTINSGNSQPIIIGRQDGAAGTSFNGKIDQIRLFNKALSSSEVTTLYGETSASATKSTTDIFGDLSGRALYEFEGNANDTGLGQAFTGQSADFNGSSQINVSSNSIFDTTSNFTLSMWVNRDSTSEKCLINKLGSTASGWFFTWNPTYGYWFNNYNGSGNANTRQNGPSDSVGEWTHLVLTWDASTYTPKLYINGVSPSSNITNVGGGGSTSSNNFEIGGGASYSGMAQYDGQMDDVKWFSSVISDSDIEKLSLNLNTTATPVGHWKLDGNANDSLGNYNGTWSGTAAYSNAAEVPKYNGTATNVLYAYDGTPTNVSFVGTSFQPDFVWVKSRVGNYWHVMQDSVRGAGAGKSIYPNGPQTEGAFEADGYISAINANGFSVSEGASSSLQTNGNNIKYVSWCWKAGGTAASNTDGSITSSVSANSDAGFSIVKYTGNSTNSTVGHGLSSAPELVLYKNLDSATNWTVYNSTLTDSYYLKLNSLDAKISEIYNIFNGEPDSSVLKLGSGSSINNSGDNFIAYCFRSVDGYQKIGTYTGNSSTTGPLINVGFRPRFILVKGTTSSYSSHWVIIDSLRDTQIEKNLRLLANSTLAEEADNNWKVEFNDNGFQPKSTFSGFNDSNGTYLYLAIA